MAVVDKTSKIDEFVYLELAFCKYYMLGQTRYESETVYKFTKDEAIKMLALEDGGKSIWRRVHLGKKEAKPAVDTSTPKIVDATQVKITTTANNDDPTSKPKPIEIGNDEEIAALIGDTDNVTL